MESAHQAMAFGVLATHSAFVAWVFAGGFLGRRSRPLFTLHMASLGWGLFTVATGFPCPLTRLENHFRALGGLAPYSAECIPHYFLIPLGVPPGLLAVALLVVPAVILNLLAYRPRHRNADA